MFKMDFDAFGVRFLSVLALSGWSRRFDKPIKERSRFGQRFQVIYHKLTESAFP